MMKKELRNSVLSCARYAYKPNNLNFCGPDKNNELKEYIKAKEDDGGLVELLQNFECMFPNLKFIADRNKVENPLDKNIIKAYWVGNSCLRNTNGSKFYYHIADTLGTKKKVPRKSMETLRTMIDAGANAHHSFHVFSVWKNANYAEDPNILYMMNECRIGWGRVKSIVNDIITVKYRPIIFENKKLVFGEIVDKKVYYELGSEMVGTDDWISFHWSSFCEALSLDEIQNLKYWTNFNLRLANISV